MYIKKKPRPDTLSQEDIYSLGERIYDPQLKVLYYILYLTGARITEVLKLRRKDIYWATPQKKQYLNFKLITLKNRKFKERELPVVVSQDIEGRMAEVIIDWCNRFESGETIIFKFKSRNNATMRLKRMLKVYVRAFIEGKTEIIEEYPFRIHPHYLRHCRLTHLVTMHNWDSIRLMQFAGWTSPKPAEIYIRLKSEDLRKR